VGGVAVLELTVGVTAVREPVAVVVDLVDAVALGGFLLGGEAGPGVRAGDGGVRHGSGAVGRRGSIRDAPDVQRRGEVRVEIRLGVGEARVRWLRGRVGH
jgi:hypothetical protein